MLIHLRDKFGRASNYFSNFFSFDLNSSSNQIEIWQYILLALLLFFACFYGISSYAILDMNEGLYAEVAREMLVNKHFIIPYLNNVPYLEKPPLLYWLIAISYQCFGINEFAARLIPSIFLALTALSVFYVAHRLKTARVGFISTVILLSSLVFIMIGRTVFFDMALTFFITASLFSFYFWLESKSFSDLYLGYLFLALAVLTKGLLALILLPLIILIYLVVTRAEKKVYVELLNKKALLIFLVIVLPWHIMALISFPPFFWEYFINNQFLRFLNLRVPHDYHVGPIYFYLPRMIAYLLPWTLFLPFIFWPNHLTKSTDFNSTASLKTPSQHLKKFLYIWFLVMFVFFSLSGDKGDYYLVIGTVPLAYLIAEKIENWISLSNAKWLTLGFYMATSTLIAAAVVGFLLYTSHDAHSAGDLYSNKIPFVLKGSILFLMMELSLYLVAGSYLIKKSLNRAMLSFLLISGLVIPLLILYLNVRMYLQSIYSQEMLAKYVRAQYQQRTVYFYQDFETLSSFVFYNEEPSIMIDSKSADLYFGEHTKYSNGKFISISEFLSQSNKTPVYVVIKNQKYKDFQNAIGAQYKNKFCVVQANGQVLLLSSASEDCHAEVDISQGEQKDINLEDLKKVETQKPKF